MRYLTAQRRIVWSASDLKAAAECEFAWLRAIDAKAGRIAAVDDPADAMLERAAQLGTEHERRILQRYRDRFGDGVREIAQTRSTDASGMAAAVEATADALADERARVIYQAAFQTEEFVGFADFLVRDEQGRWIVQDSKLARHARVTALMQLAAYADQLERLDAPVAPEVELLLGDGATSAHRLDDIMPVFRLRRDRLRALVADRCLDDEAHPAIAWGDERGDLAVAACGRCPTCEHEVIAHRDLLLVAGMRPVHRERLRAVGIDTIDALAEASGPVDRIPAEVFTRLHRQARLQLASPTGLGQEGATVAAPSYEVTFPAALAAMPRPDDGDLFFDFEGDPLYTEGGGQRWGLDYLFGWVDMREQYTPLWAHDFAQERIALERFLDIVALARRAGPGMHIYHYAPYEPAHLQSIAARHGVREAEVDTLLREGVFVDLYPIVRRALAVGSRSYSIKKLEPLYMGDDRRASDVQRGDDSITAYVHARMLDEAGAHADARAALDDLAEYNRDDCVSTKRLRDWLVDRARESALVPSRDVESTDQPYAPSLQAERLRALAEEEPTTDADALALRLGAAAIDYHPREAKTFWFAHFERLREPLSLWAETRDVVSVDAAASTVTEDWQPGARSTRRTLLLRGEQAPGTRLREGARPFAIYEVPAPFSVGRRSPRWIHVAREVTIVEADDDAVVVTESAGDGDTWDALPIALAPASPPSAGGQQRAIEEWAAVLASGRPLPADPATDILRRLPPRMRGGAPFRVQGGDDQVGAITAAVRELDHSAVAVQGPPGTGKTYVGSHVIARLVTEHGWKVGVVAQSHDVVENLLARVVDAGVPASQVGKTRRRGATGEVPFTAVPHNGLRRFTTGHPEGGYVIGGTAWDLSNTGRVPRRSLDLLVIDEAGQFSLASTIAVAAAAERLLLLGDPQQLPQVSQGVHPEPVDGSALGWLMHGDAVLPPERGFFLDRTWRMHPAVTAAVSDLAYAGRLHARERASQRAISGITPGVHPVAVPHTGNSSASPEEADAVVDLVRDLIGREWTDVDTDDRAVTAPLRQDDVIVVTPYNAQQVTVEKALAAAGFAGVRVGTVDRFQGQEAAVSIVTFAASSGRDAPRGLEFLLLQNRVNVAVSRAKVAAYLVYSPGLLDALPYTPDGVARLSAFARLVGVT